MIEFIIAGRMFATRPNEYRCLESYYIPLQYFLKKRKRSHALKSSVDASTKISLELSLNDATLAGPKLQKKNILNSLKLSSASGCPYRPCVSNVYVYSFRPAAIHLSTHYMAPFTR